MALEIRFVTKMSEVLQDFKFSGEFGDRGGNLGFFF